MRFLFVLFAFVHSDYSADHMAIFLKAYACFEQITNSGLISDDIAHPELQKKFKIFKQCLDLAMTFPPNTPKEDLPLAYTVLISLKKAMISLKREYLDIVRDNSILEFNRQRRAFLELQEPVDAEFQYTLRMLENLEPAIVGINRPLIIDTIRNQHLRSMVQNIIAMKAQYDECSRVIRDLDIFAPGSFDALASELEKFSFDQYRGLIIQTNDLMLSM